MTSIIASRFANIWQKNDLLFKIFARDIHDRQKKVIETLHNFTEVIIRTRRDELVQSAQSNDDADVNMDNGLRSNKMALLDILLKSSIDGEPLSNEDIREEVDTFMFGVRHLNSPHKIYCQLMRHFNYVGA